MRDKYPRSFPFPHLSFPQLLAGIQGFFVPGWVARMEGQKRKTLDSRFRGNDRVWQWGVILLTVACSVVLLGATGAGQPSPEERLGLAERAFAQGDFQKTVDLVEPLLDDAPWRRASFRLKMLSLVRLGKTAEGIRVYEQFVETDGSDEGLLRELAVQSILPFRADMREQVRGAAYSALKEIPSDEVVPYFQDGLSDGSGMIRVLVAEGMGKFPKGLQSESFRNALKDQAGLVRVTVLKALGGMGDPAAIPLVAPLLKDEHRVVQVAAAAALYRLGQKEHWQTVEQATNVPEGYERGGALRMLGEIGDPKGLPLLEQGLRDKQPSIRAAAAASLGKLGSSKGIPFLIKALADPVPAVRSVAAVTLGKLRAERAVSSLTRVLQDRNPGVRAAAVAGLLQLSSPFSVMAGTVRELMGQQNPGLRSSVAKALSHGRARDVVGPLLLLLNDPVPKPRISAARSLGRVGGRELIPRLKPLMKDQNEAVRATAAGAIARLLSASPEA